MSIDKRKPRLWIIDGADRCGKDSFVNWLKTQDDFNKKFVVYDGTNKPRPDYRKEPKAFEEWVKNHLFETYTDIVDLKNKTGKDIVTVRLLASEYVYSNLFDRDSEYDKIHKMFNDTFICKSLIFLFRDYQEYLRRLRFIGEDAIKPEYSKIEFEIVSGLYSQFKLDNPMSSWIYTVEDNKPKDDYEKLKSFITY